MRIQITSKHVGAGGLAEFKAAMQRYIADERPIPMASWKRVSDVISDSLAQHYREVIAPAIGNTTNTANRKVQDIAKKRKFKRIEDDEAEFPARYTDTGMHTGFLLQKLASPSALPRGNPWKIERVSTDPRSKVNQGKFEMAFNADYFTHVKGKGYPSRYFSPDISISAGSKGLSAGSASIALAREIVEKYLDERFVRAFKRGGK